MRSYISEVDVRHAPGALLAAAQSSALPLAWLCLWEPGLDNLPGYELKGPSSLLRLMVREASF